MMGFRGLGFLGAILFSLACAVVQAQVPGQLPAQGYPGGGMGYPGGGAPGMGYPGGAPGMGYPGGGGYGYYPSAPYGGNGNFGVESIHTPTTDVTHIHGQQNSWSPWGGQGSGFDRTYVNVHPPYGPYPMPMQGMGYPHPHFHGPRPMPYIGAGVGIRMW